PITWPLLPHHVRYMLRAHETLKDLVVSRQHLGEAQRIAGIGNFRWLPQIASLECSPELCRMFGVSDSAGSVSVRSLLRRIAATDRPAVIHAVRAGMRGERVDVDHRVAPPGEELRILCLRAELTTADDGTLYLQGSFQDITERKRVEIELAMARD